MQQVKFEVFDLDRENKLTENEFKYLTKKINSNR